YSPLAIVELILIISYSRGYKVFEAIGNIKVKALSKGLLQAPVFTFYIVDDALGFYYYVLIF
ncbi:hypothetical protein F5882DRAFT_290892, partial [Hyaloscypha sp. PMI_1271]